MHYQLVILIGPLSAIIGAVAVGSIWSRIHHREMAQQREHVQQECAREMSLMRDQTRQECEASWHNQQLMLGEQSKQFYLMKEESDKIALFLREAYAMEIQQGRHANRDLADIVISYLQCEREQHRIFQAASQQRAVNAIHATTQLNQRGI